MLNACRRPNNLDRNHRYSAEDRGRASHGVVVRNCADCTLTGLHVNGVRHAQAGVRIENCRPLNVTRLHYPRLRQPRPA